MSRQPAVIVDVDDTLCDISEIRYLYAVPDDYREFTVASRGCLPRREESSPARRRRAFAAPVLSCTPRLDATTMTGPPEEPCASFPPRSACPGVAKPALFAGAV